MSSNIPSTAPGSLENNQNDGFPPRLDRRQPLTPWWLWVITTALLVVVIVGQRPDTSAPKNQAELANGTAKITAPESSELILLSKLGLAIKAFTAGMPGAGSGGPNDPNATLIAMNDQLAGWVSKNPMLPVSAANPPTPQKEPTPAVTRFRATIVGGLLGLNADELSWRFNDVESGLAIESVLHDDLRVARSLLGVSPGRGDGPATDESAAFAESVPAVSPTQAELDAFRARHGWFADAIIPAAGGSGGAAAVVDSARQQGMQLLGIFVVAFAIVGSALLVGVVLLIVGAVHFFSRRAGNRLLMPKPVASQEWPNVADGDDAPSQWPTLAQPGSVWLETFAVFLAAFLGVKLIGTGLVAIFGKDAPWLPVASVGLQWLVLPTIFWPMLRGMPSKRWRADMGWHGGQGVAKELACGLMGYLAFLPMYFVLAMIVVLLMLIIQAIFGGSHTPSNKVLEIVEGGSAFELLMVYLLATIWAPVVEESIFRGALFRFFRGRTPMLVAAFITASIFAALHGYLVVQLLLVGSLGFWFALLRSWRGSIIAPMLGHMIHNGFVLALVLTVAQYMKP